MDKLLELFGVMLQVLFLLIVLGIMLFVTGAIALGVVSIWELIF